MVKLKLILHLPISKRRAVVSKTTDSRQQSNIPFSVIPYEITVFTGDKSGAGTDAKVFIQMYGLNGKTDELVLANKSNTFEQKSVRMKLKDLILNNDVCLLD
jgi:hypothetical protein